MEHFDGESTFSSTHFVEYIWKNGVSAGGGGAVPLWKMQQGLLLKKDKTLKLKPWFEEY